MALLLSACQCKRSGAPDTYEMAVNVASLVVPGKERHQHVRRAVADAVAFSDEVVVLASIRRK